MNLAENGKPLFFNSEKKRDAKISTLQLMGSDECTSIMRVKED